jgi:hypothetical protein
LPRDRRIRETPAGKAGSGGQCSIALVKRRLAFLGGIAVGLAALWRSIRRRPRGWGEPEAPTDPRAEDLRARLDESRPVVEDREEFESAETTVDAVDAVPDPDERRRAVHAEGRAAVDRMRGDGED